MLDDRYRHARATCGRRDLMVKAQSAPACLAAAIALAASFMAAPATAELEVMERI